jgi:hypothetical protein
MPRSAQYRHPRPGTGSGYRYSGYGYGHSHGYGYGYGHGYGHSHGYGYGHSHGYGYGYHPYAPTAPTPTTATTRRRLRPRPELLLRRRIPVRGRVPASDSGAYATAEPYATQPYPSEAPYAGDGGYAPSEPYGGEQREQEGDSYDPGQPPAQAPAEAAELQILVQPQDASVWVDGQFRGSASALGRLVLSPGRHRIDVARPHFRPAARNVDLQPGMTASLRIALEPGQ